MTSTKAEFVLDSIPSCDESETSMSRDLESSEAEDGLEKTVHSVGEGRGMCGMGRLT